MESCPKPLLVQATPAVMKNQPAGDWRRVKLAGKVPPVLRVSEWALRGKRKFRKCLRVVLVAPVILVLLSLPLEKIWDDAEFDQSYTELPNYTWDYPKHARNRLDVRPRTQRRANNSITSGDRPANSSTKVRLLRPRFLMLLNNGERELTSDTSRAQYAFISFTARHFPFRVSGRSPLSKRTRLDKQSSSSPSKRHRKQGWELTGLISPAVRQMRKRNFTLWMSTVCAMSFAALNMFSSCYQTWR